MFDRARAFLEQRGPEDPPFLLFAHTHAVHDYYMPERPTRAERRRARRFGACLLGRRACPERTWRRMEARYRDRVRRLDRAFARLEETLRRRGLEEETLVVLLSDHGEGFRPEEGRIHHGGRLHADQLRVPLLVRGPGIPPGERSARVSLVDVMPTLLELLEVPPPDGLDGRSAAAALRGELAARDRPVYASEHAYHWGEGERVLVESVRDRALSAARVDDAHWLIASAEGRPELYAREDRAQRHDLAAKVPALAAKFRARLEAHLGPSRPARPRSPGVPEGLRGQLEALGYLEAE